MNLLIGSLEKTIKNLGKALIPVGYSLAVAIILLATAIWYHGCQLDCKEKEPPHNGAALSLADKFLARSYSNESSTVKSSLQSP